MALSLSRWLATHGVWLDPRVHLESTTGTSSSSTSVASTSSIPAGTTRKSCSL